MASKKTPEVNASSTADIAFLLLVFFLVTTTMDVDKGISRRLPPMPDENQKVEDQKINKRNIGIVRINQSDRIFVGSGPVDISELKDRIVEFITNPSGDPNLPEKEMTQIEGIGEYPVAKGVVSLQNDRGTSYSKYIAVQNEIVRAFNEIRDNFSEIQFGKKYNKLTEDQQAAVRKAIPQNISEAEPKDVSKKK